jgi:hypothetical protein
VIPLCPICGGTMELVYSRPSAQVCVCIECHTSITVPSRAWDVPHAKERIGRLPPESD